MIENSILQQKITEITIDMIFRLFPRFVKIVSYLQNAASHFIDSYLYESIIHQLLYLYPETRIINSISPLRKLWVKSQANIKIKEPISSWENSLDQAPMQFCVPFTQIKKKKEQNKRHNSKKCIQLQLMKEEFRCRGAKKSHAQLCKEVYSFQIYYYRTNTRNIKYSKWHF